MVRLNTQSLHLPVQEPDFGNNIAIFNRKLEQMFGRVENEFDNIEFMDFDVTVKLSGNVNLVPPPFIDVEYTISPDFTPEDITEQIRNILSKEFGAFATLR
ncbi:MAG: hypothetical protein WBO31_09165 [Saprospiraceae bacterium]|nr:hypothetical protein [Saprospiraceae bacterium]